MLKMKTVLCLFLIALLLLPPAVPAEDVFETIEVFSQRTQKTMTCRVYIPPEIDADTVLTVFLHGGGQMREDPLEAALPAAMISGTVKCVPALVAVPQIPGGVGEWAKVADAVLEMADTLTERYGLDPRNSSLCGFSMGGIGAMDIANRYPGRFTKILIAAGRVNEGIRAASFTGSQVRFYVGRRDRDIRSDTVYGFEKKLKWANVDVMICETDTDHLGTEKTVFTDPDILAWLFSPLTTDTGK